MKPTPKGWPRISSALFYKDPAAAIDWICRVFDFKIRIKVEGEKGEIVHSELEYGEGLIMVGDVARRGGRASPKAIDGRNTQSLMVYVDDVEAHFKKAKQLGAKILEEPKTSDYGEEYWADRSYEVEDLEGHRWWISQRMRG